MRRQTRGGWWRGYGLRPSRYPVKPYWKPTVNPDWFTVIESVGHELP